MHLEPMLAIFNLGGTEIILILAIALLLFGGKKLPELAKGLGQGIREFKQAAGGASVKMRDAMEETTRHLPPASAVTEHSILQAAPGAKTI